MPKIYDNIENQLIQGLKQSLDVSYRADFCVGYFNLRGWKHLADYIDRYEGTDSACCRLLIGMQRPPEDLLKEALSKKEQQPMDNATASYLKKRLAREFRQQLMFGIPTDNDESGLRKLASQLKSKKLIVKLFLKHPLHAKLYLLYRQDNLTPIIGYVGSSNLTLAGLEKQGELNLDVLEQDAAEKLSRWFEGRWNDRYCIDITDELADIIDESWAGEKLIKPYYIYLKVAYHLSQEAQLGLNNYIIPQNFKQELLPFQANAVSIAARHLDKRGGVLIGDVVGLGKTITACALAKLFEDMYYLETLVICPKNLVAMWDEFMHKYQIRGKVKSISAINDDFIEERRYRIVIIDESHNLRNREGKRYGLIKEYIEINESKVILLTATPYNKTYYDISNQLRLFIPEDQDIGISPERFIGSIGGPIEFIARYQYSPNTILAFEKSDFTDDWRDLLKLYMVRRTRHFIKQNYAELDRDKGQYYLTFHNGERFYFPERLPKKLEYEFDQKDKKDIYAHLYSERIVDTINSLNLPRYGLGNYIDKPKTEKISDKETQILNNLSRAGKRLMGFCRTNLYKRLESCGYAFLISLARHLMRNYLFLYALNNNLHLPIGSQEIEDMDEFLEENDADIIDSGVTTFKAEHTDFLNDAKELYKRLSNDNKVEWINSSYFKNSLKTDIESDCKKLLEILTIGKQWDANNDKKINALYDLIAKKYRTDKILIFTQYADTAGYLNQELIRRGASDIGAVTGATENPTHFARRFSPISNEINHIGGELRILITTDVLSEGQNLQDCHIIVNFDLPWALIRLIQRAGRVDRIGQKEPQILCYSFIPAEGLNQIIRLRERLARRIKENAEVVGADEVFFDGDPVNITDIYSEKAGMLDEEDDEVDLTSTAYEIWNQAIKARPELKKIIPNFPNVIYSTKPLPEDMSEGEGVVCYHKTANDIDVLTWLSKDERIISNSQSRILKAMVCDYNTPALPRLDEHHKLVEQAIEISRHEEKATGGQLGKKSGARYQAYMRLLRYYEENKGTLFENQQLKNTIDEIYKYPLRESAKDVLNKRLKLGISDEGLAQLVIELRADGRLCKVEDETEKTYESPQIICSMGMSRSNS